eukprot:s2067_g5.t1
MFAVDATSSWDEPLTFAPASRTIEGPVAVAVAESSRADDTPTSLWEFLQSRDAYLGLRPGGPDLGSAYRGWAESATAMSFLKGPSRGVAGVFEHELAEQIFWTNVVDKELYSLRGALGSTPILQDHYRAPTPPTRCRSAAADRRGRKHLQVALPVISIRELNAKGWPSLNPIPIRTSQGLRKSDSAPSLTIASRGYMPEPELPTLQGKSRRSRVRRRLVAAEAAQEGLALSLGFERERNKLLVEQLEAKPVAAKISDRRDKEMRLRKASKAQNASDVLASARRRFDEAEALQQLPSVGHVCLRSHLEAQQSRYTNVSLAQTCRHPTHGPCSTATPSGCKPAPHPTPYSKDAFLLAALPWKPSVSTASMAAVWTERILALPGNRRCFDCDVDCALDPWVSVSHATVICIQCAGVHRSFGVHVSYVRSLKLDSIKESEWQQLLQGGGNEAFSTFLLNSQCVPRNVWHALPMETRYHTPAADLYRRRLQALAAGNEDLPEELRPVKPPAPVKRSEPEKGAPLWKDSAKCQLCKVDFWLVVRKHHCRKCGRCICSGCSPAECQRPIPELGIFEPSLRQSLTDELARTRALQSQLKERWDRRSPRAEERTSPSQSSPPRLAVEKRIQDELMEVKSQRDAARAQCRLQSEELQVLSAKVDVLRQQVLVREEERRDLVHCLGESLGAPESDLSVEGLKIRLQALVATRDAALQNAQQERVNFEMFKVELDAMRQQRDEAQLRLKAEEQRLHCRVEDLVARYGKSSSSNARKSAQWLAATPGKGDAAAVAERLLNAVKPIIFLRAAKYELDAQSSKAGDVAAAGKAQAPRKRRREEPSSHEAPSGEDVDRAVEAFKALASQPEQLRGFGEPMVFRMIGWLVATLLASSPLLQTAALGFAPAGRGPQARGESLASFPNYLHAGAEAPLAGSAPRAWGAAQRGGRQGKVRELNVAEGVFALLLSWVMRVAAGLGPASQVPAEGRLHLVAPWQPDLPAAAQDPPPSPKPKPVEAAASVAILWLQLGLCDALLRAWDL